MPDKNPENTTEETTTEETPKVVPVTEGGTPPVTATEEGPTVETQENEVEETDEQKAEREAAEAKAAEETEETPEEEAELDASVWGDTGNETGNAVLQLLQNAEMEPADAKALLFDAVQEGDVSKIDVAALEAKIGKNKTALVLTGIKGYISDRDAQNAEVVKTVHAVTGGEEGWNKVATWAVANQPEKIEELRPMIDAGGEQAEYAAGRLLALYNADAKNTSITPSNPRIEPTAQAAPAVVAITRDEYVKQLDAEYMKSSPSKKRLDEIQAARNLGRKQGI